MHRQAQSGIYYLTLKIYSFQTFTSLLFPTGAAAQEVIKIITKQFVIFNNTYIYSGMSQTSATFQL
jgi:hypothetical protein